MKILVEITHPAHIHFFRNAIGEWKSHGHTVAVTARDKEMTLELLKLYGIEHTVLSSIGKGKLSLFYELVERDFKLWRFCREFRPDVLTAVGGVFAAHVGRLIRKPVVVWDDTEHAGISHKMTFPFATSIQTPDCYTKKLGAKQVSYPGCHELAYLHPSRFTPDADIVKSLGIEPDEKYCLIRFVSWQAHHDVGQKGFDKNAKVKFVERIAEYGRPLITSESELPAELEKYRLKVPVHQIHHIMAFADLCITEGATMASESALLGVPVIYINTLTAGTIKEFEKYELMKRITDTDEALEYAVVLLENADTAQNSKKSLAEFLENRIDVTKYIAETIEGLEK